MKLSRLAKILFLLAIAAPALHAQNQEGVLSWPPTPAGPNEPVSIPAHALITPAERTAALELLDRARQNSSLFVPRATPFDIKVSFTATGAEYDGAGSLEEIWFAPNLWRFTAQLGDFSMMRGVSRGPFFGENSADVVPMRVQSAWHIMMSPIAPVSSNSMLRSADVNWRGMQLTCVLVSGDVPKDVPRHWVEFEYCIEPRTGLLRLYSIAPGMYVVYDYSKALQFDGHEIPREITEFIGESVVLAIHIQEISDASNVDHATLEPPTPMQRMNPLTTAQRLPMIVNGPRVAGVPINCVIVHATVDPQGKILEEEVAASSLPELSQRALDLVKNTTMSHAPPGTQREVFINVQFIGKNPN
jgi:hypothetical protein